MVADAGQDHAEKGRMVSRPIACARISTQLECAVAAMAETPFCLVSFATMPLVYKIDVANVSTHNLYLTARAQPRCPLISRHMRRSTALAGQDDDTSHGSRRRAPLR
eukprot:6176196-Pleurochrysis_carterae.AAC.2